MNGKVKVLFNSGLYTFSSILARAIGFLLLPIYTLYLSPDDYGITNLVISFNSVATFIVAFSLYSAVLRFYSDYKNDRQKLKKFYGTAVTFVFLSGIFFVGMGFLVQEILVKWFFEGVAFYPYLVIALLNLTFDCLHTLHQSILQGMQAGKKLTIINLTVFGLQVGLNLLLIAVLKLGAVGFLLAMLIVSLGYSIFMVIDLKKSDLVTFGIDREILKEALAYSLPIMPHNLSTHIAAFASRIFINTSGSLAAVGLYSVAWQFGAIIDTVQTSVNKAFAPWFYDVMSDDHDSGKKDIVSLSQFLLVLYSLVYMVIGLFSQEAIILMTTERFTLSWTVVPILVVGFSVKSIYYFYVNVLFYYKQASNKIFIATIAGSLADITLASIFVPLYGMYGAAVAFLIAKVIIVAIVILMNKKYDDVGYRFTGMLKTIVPSLLFMGAGLYFSYTKYLTEFSWINLLYKAGVLFTYLVFVYFTNRVIIDTIIKSGRIQNIFRRKKSVLSAQENN